MLTELKCWRWLPGMLTEDGWRLDCPSDGEWEATSSLAHRSYHKPASGPRLTDPATWGCCIALLSEKGWRFRIDSLDKARARKPGAAHWGPWLPLKEAIEAALRMEG